MSLARVAVGGIVAAGVVRSLTREPGRLPGPAKRWERTNHAGRTVSLAEGPAVVAGTAVAALGNPPAGLAAVAAGALGMLDDLAGGATSSKGLRGHLSALRRGEVTTGAVKIVGLGVVGLGSAVALDRGVAMPTLVGAGVVAGSANLVNLFDLRPGRALKVTLLAAVPMLWRGGLVEGALAGTALAALPEDLAAEQMMGDTGANALGALAGVALVARTRGPGRAAALAVLTALTLASERVSFSRVIDEQPVLRRVDEWGRAAA